MALPARAAHLLPAQVFWHLLYQHRVLEAVLATPEVRLAELDASVVFEIGAHARDVLGHAAGRCQSLQWVFPLIWRELPDLIPDIDPWWPELPEPLPPLPPFVDPTPLIDFALWGALLALREEFPVPSGGPRPGRGTGRRAARARGAAHGLQVGLKAFGGAVDRFARLKG